MSVSEWYKYKTINRVKAYQYKFSLYFSVVKCSQPPSVFIGYNMFNNTADLWTGSSSQGSCVNDEVTLTLPEAVFVTVLLPCRFVCWTSWCCWRTQAAFSSSGVSTVCSSCCSFAFSFYTFWTVKHVLIGVFHTNVSLKKTTCFRKVTESPTAWRINKR